MLPLLQNVTSEWIATKQLDYGKLNDVLFVGAIALVQSVLRYSENEEEELYTPKFLPGKDKEHCNKPDSPDSIDWIDDSDVK